MTSMTGEIDLERLASAPAKRIIGRLSTDGTVRLLRFPNGSS
jgi:hypothetical protein